MEIRIDYGTIWYMIIKWNGDETMEDYKEIVKYFNKIFETKIYIDPKELPLLTALYRRFKEDLYIETPKYNKVKAQKNKQGKLLEEMFNDEQQKLMDDAFATSVDIIDDFISGHGSQYLMNKYN